MTTEAQARAKASYYKKSVTVRRAEFYPAEADILAWLDAQPNKAGYIKALIRADMEKQQRHKT